MSSSQLTYTGFRGYQLANQLTEDGWIGFAHKLKEQEQNGCSNGRIRSIFVSCSRYCYDVTDEVLEEFAGLESLETLRIAYNNNITDAGFNTFTTANSSNNNKQKKMELYDCNNVSLENPRVVFVNSPF